MIKSDFFDSHKDLTKFCNRNNITKEKIITIIYRPDTVSHYVIFYEE